MDHGRLDLQRIFSDALQNASSEQAAIFAWPVVCGASVANKTRALDFSRGVLRVQVPDIAWRTELETLTADYVRALNAMVVKKVSRIEFVVPTVRTHELEVIASRKKAVAE